MERRATSEEKRRRTEAGALLETVDRTAIRALLALAAEATGAERATLCIGGRGLSWCGRASAAKPQELDTVACAGPCGSRQSAACAPHQHSEGDRHALAVRAGDGALPASLCLTGAVPARVREATLEAVAAEASAQLSLHLRLARDAMLAKEADHRIKNALQSVASYLRLQEQRTLDTDARSSLGAACRHVRAIALIHDEIAGSGGPESIRLDQTLARLAELLDALTPEFLRVVVGVAPVMVPREKATLLAVIANEFVTNAAKHAFRPGSCVTVRITAEARGDGRLQVVMADDGPGLMPVEGGGGLGLRIMETAAAKLGASLTVGTGTRGGYRLALTMSCAKDSEGSGLAALAECAPSV